MVVVFRIEKKDGFWFTESYSAFFPRRKLRLKWKEGIDIQFLLWYYGDSEEGYPTVPFSEMCFWDDEERVWHE